MLPLRSLLTAFADEDGSADAPALALLALLTMMLAQSTTAQIRGLLDRTWDRMEAQLAQASQPAGSAGPRPDL